MVVWVVGDVVVYQYKVGEGGKPKQRYETLGLEKKNCQNSLLPCSPTGETLSNTYWREINDMSD